HDRALPAFPTRRSSDLELLGMDVGQRALADLADAAGRAAGVDDESFRHGTWFRWRWCGAPRFTPWRSVSPAERTPAPAALKHPQDRKSTRLNSSHVAIS